MLVGSSEIWERVGRGALDHRMWISLPIISCTRIKQGTRGGHTECSNFQLLVWNSNVKLASHFLDFLSTALENRWWLYPDALAILDGCTIMYSSRCSTMGKWRDQQDNHNRLIRVISHSLSYIYIQCPTPISWMYVPLSRYTRRADDVESDSYRPEGYWWGCQAELCCSFSCLFVECCWWFRRPISNIRIL